MDSDRRAVRHMRLPERGTLRVTGVHDGHSHETITGVVTVPGISPRRVEHKTGERGRVAIGQDLPVVVDRADPSRLVILWEEVGTAASSPPFQYGPESSVSSTVVTIGPDGQPYTAQMPGDLAARVEAAVEQAFSQRGRPMPPHMAARMEEALNRALSQAGPQGQAVGEAIRQALNHAPGQPYGPSAGQPYGAGPGPNYGSATGQPYGAAPGQNHDPATGQLYGPGAGQPSGPTAGQSYGLPVDQPYGPGPAGQSYGPGPAGQSYGPGPAGQSYGLAAGPPFDPAGGSPFGQDGQGAADFPQVSWTGQNASGAPPQPGFIPAQQLPPSGGGELATAVVLAAQDVAPMPGYAAAGGIVDVTLEVRRADGSGYTTRTRLSITTPERRAAVATPGTRLSVRIDPNDPTRVEIDPSGRF
jgi:hypothetical protein